MKKKLSVVTVLFALAILLVIFGFSAMAHAQTPTVPAPTLLVDHWSTSEACLAATSAPFYYPSILAKHELGKNEGVRGIPSGACVEMNLPDRMGGKGWVRIEAGRRFVYDRINGKVLRLAECNNTAFAVVSFAPLVGIPGATGPQGIQGIPGPQGLRGEAGFDGTQGPRGPKGKDGFCSSKKCKIVLVAIGGAAAGYAAWYYWPCPPGTTRKY